MTLPLCRNTRKIHQSTFTVPIIQEYGAPVGCDACLRHLSKEIEIAEKNGISQYGKVLCTHPACSTWHCTCSSNSTQKACRPPNGSYIFCPDRQQSRKIAVVWPDHRVTPTASCRAASERRLLQLDWTSSHLLAQSKRKKAIWMKARSIVFVQRAAE
jgi:hypothetical protein